MECFDILVYFLFSVLSTGVLCFCMFLFDTRQLVMALFIFLPVFYNKKWYRWIYFVVKTLPRDLVYYWRYYKLTRYINAFVRENQTVTSCFQHSLQKNPLKVMIHSEYRSWTFLDVEEYTNRIANYFKTQGITKGDTVALFMESCAEHILVWLALSKLGAATALINFHQTKAPLVHSLTIVRPKAVIFSHKTSAAFNEIRSDIECSKHFQLFSSDEEVLEGAVNVTKAMENCSIESLSEDIKSFSHSDPIIYVYTSGTTGLPKAAIFSHERFMLHAAYVRFLSGIREDDVIYDCLPLYHGAGTILGMGQAVVFGNTVCIRSKFSASNFWKECAKYKCTVAQYIGEICRYLLAVPSGDLAEKKHQIRCMYGNGMKAHIWTKFKQRFRISEMAELYGASESNCLTMNFDGTPGSCGIIPYFMQSISNLLLVRYDIKTNEPLRNKFGLCIPCNRNETGLLLGRTSDKIVEKLLGYTNRDETAKKMISNVVKKGDIYFSTGDLLMLDDFGRLYFKDRLGDTFRWKGENIATSEIESVLSNLLRMRDAAAYGVQVPHTEGKCGMVAIMNQDDGVDLEALAKDIRQCLPSYAIPLFVRLLKTVALTATFKIRKCDLKEVGFDIHKTTDEIYFYNSSIQKYVLLDDRTYENILSGNVRL